MRLLYYNSSESEYIPTELYDKIYNAAITNCFWNNEKLIQETCQKIGIERENLYSVNP